MDHATKPLTMTSKRPNFQYPPTPRILHFPRRPRRKVNLTPKSKHGGSVRERRGKLETLFDQERVFARGRGGLPTSVIMSSGGEAKEIKSVDGEENVEKWRFQAEMLRAECKLLRMEREIAIKKMERRRVLVESTLRSALHALLSGRQRISDGTGYTASKFLEELQVLAEKLDTLLRRLEVKSSKSRKCCNFDRQASALRSRLERFEGDSNKVHEKEIKQMPGASVSTKTASTAINYSNNHQPMDERRRKMDGLPEGTRTLMERIKEEYQMMLPTTSGAAASSYKRMESPDAILSSTRPQCKESKSSEDRECSGCCKDIVRRVVAQVRAETEQWSQMQEMLGQVRDEMEELQVSRDFWEDRAFKSDIRIQSLCSAVEDWKQRALASEAKLDELRVEASTLHSDLQKLKSETETANNKKNSSPISRETPTEMEKRIQHCRFKENQAVKGVKNNNKEVRSYSDSRRPHLDATRPKDTRVLPLKEIGNTTPVLVRQKSRAVFPLHGP